MQKMIASLDMYSWSETRSAWATLWQNVRKHLVDAGLEAPEELTTASDPWQIWRSPDLLLGHTCGWPYISELKDEVALVGTFDFGLKDLPPAYYDSVIIGRTPISGGQTIQDLITEEEVSIAVNGLDSQSGFRVYREFLDAEPMQAIQPFQIIHSGSHRNSIAAVADGDADIAAIDAVTWQMAQEYEPQANDVCILAQSRPVPGLPLITAKANAEKLHLIFDAVVAAIDEGSKPKNMPTGLVSLASEDYEILK